MRALFETLAPGQTGSHVGHGENKIGGFELFEQTNIIRKEPMISVDLNLNHD